MKIKKYVADDYQSAFKQARKEMGRDAIILSTRQVKKGGFLGFFTRTKVELTVAVDDDMRVERDKLRIVPQESNSLPSASDPALNSNSNPVGEQELQLLQEMYKMNDIMADIKGKMYEVELIKGISQPVQEFYKTLINNHVDQAIALRMANSVEGQLPGGKGDYNWVKDVCLHTLQGFLEEIKPIECNDGDGARIVVMVGPTGVGKTTTIAKLAANLTFIDSRQVAFITLDTYRVSAAEQLKTFADIIGVPIKVVFSPADLGEAIESYRDKDIIFIDTAGRSPYNHEHMEELHEFLDIAEADETILVLSVNTASSDLLNIYHEFNRIGVDKLIFTKLDETNCYGQILNIISEIKKPVAYFTNGQNVPDDIEVPDPFKFARMVMGKGEAL
ncbi:MAG: flagellar biosynthesis protein FlhF [Firmicutes bacterium HGW-Firmicutes-15]|nr:MAG: flagellar biosynthesis protein FlhF [Firmicutes bacterium HGW-Firmicutes-15]